MSTVLGPDIEYNKVYTESEKPDEESQQKRTLLKSGKSLMIRSNTAKPNGSGNATQRISLSDIPPELAERLKHLDLGNDGYLDLEDILVLDEKEQQEEKTMSHYKKLFIALVIVWVLQIAAVFAVSFAAINASKDSYVTNNTLQTKSGATIQVASVDFCTTSTGLMTARIDGSCPSDQISKPPAIATASATTKITLSSSLPTSTLTELKSLYLVSPTGAEVFVTVLGFMRRSSDDLLLITNIGDLSLSGTSVSVTDTTSQKYFEKAKFTLVGTGTSRRLANTELIAFKNAVQAVQEEPTQNTFSNTLIPSKSPVLSSKPVTIGSSSKPVTIGASSKPVTIEPPSQPVTIEPPSKSATTFPVLKQPVSFSVLEKQLKSELGLPQASLAIDLKKNYCSISPSEEKNVMTYAVVTQQKKLLCSAFLNLEEKSINNLISNFKTTANSCDWIVIAYAGDADLLKDIHRRNHALTHPVTIVDASMAPTPFKVLSKYCKDLPDAVMYSDGFVYPKPILYFQILPHLANYEHVWLMDEDISLNNFDVNKMMATFDKTFSTKGANHPLVTQPLLAGEARSDYFKERFAGTWKGMDEATFAMVDFVEIMAPIFDSHYFNWFVNKVVVDLLPQIYFYRSDAGLDNIWCKSAKDYYQKVLNKHVTEEGNCAIYLSNQSIEHLDWETITNTVSQDKKSYLMQKYKSSLFNTFVKEKFTDIYTDPQSDEIVHEIISNKL